MNLSDITLGHRGSVINYLTKDLITEFSFQFPLCDISSQLNIIDNLFDKIDLNTQQIQTLQKLRDTLLSKLINGEVKVNA
jgi:type I restriction enzyme S subunit